MATDSVMKWYVVRAIGGQENKVKAYIETEISRVGLSDYVSQVIVPTEKVIQIRDGKKVHRENRNFSYRVKPFSKSLLLFHNHHLS